MYYELIIESVPERRVRRFEKTTTTDIEFYLSDLKPDEQVRIRIYIDGVDPIGTILLKQ